MPHRANHSSGNVLIAVTLIGTFIMLIAGTIVNNLLVSEAAYRGQVHDADDTVELLVGAVALVEDVETLPYK